MHNNVTPKREHRAVTTFHFLQCATDCSAAHVIMRNQNTPSVQIQTLNPPLKWRNFILSLQFFCCLNRPSSHTDYWKPTTEATAAFNLVKQKCSFEFVDFKSSNSFKTSPHVDRVLQLSVSVFNARIINAIKNNTCFYVLLRRLSRFLLILFSDDVYWSFNVGSSYRGEPTFEKTKKGNHHGDLAWSLPWAKMATVSFYIFKMLKCVDWINLFIYLFQ